MPRVVNQAAVRHVGYVYATNDVLPNPYDTLPSYISSRGAWPDRLLITRSVTA
jgi:hypothetical protein